MEDKGKIDKEYNDSLEKEQTKLETNVAIAVGALKNDLRTPGVGDRKFFELILIHEYNDLQSRELYKPTTPATANSYGSVMVNLILIQFIYVWIFKVKFKRYR